MAFLYDVLVQEFGRRTINDISILYYISDNIKFEIRPYQKEAFQRFILCYSENFNGKPKRPFHLLYNTAKGNSNSIIQKTKDNFPNPQASKYLFNNKIVIEGKEVEKFEEADTQNININFTTIQQLHISLNNTKENSVTYEDFKDKKL